MIVARTMGPPEPCTSPLDTAPRQAPRTCALAYGLLRALVLTVIFASIGCTIDVLYERPMDDGDFEDDDFEDDDFEDDDFEETDTDTDTDTEGETDGETDTEGDADDTEGESDGDTDDTDTDDPLRAESPLNRIHPARRRGGEGRLILVR